MRKPCQHVARVTDANMLQALNFPAPRTRFSSIKRDTRVMHDRHDRHGRCLAVQGLDASRYLENLTNY